ncbi:SART-1 family protein [Trifolium medium]|uniref:SART-1 family protein n=1 Tax=Trifolium medium TaxID=97028 RepID=A0A392MXN1_9FABA|nr:SART-1 family protein [Trifolium medium]
MKETRTKKQSEAASEISSWVNKSRKIEKQRVLQLSKIFEEQDNIAVEGSDDEDTTHHTDARSLIEERETVIPSMCARNPEIEQSFSVVE